MQPDAQPPSAKYGGLRLGQAACSFSSHRPLEGKAASAGPAMGPEAIAFERRRNLGVTARRDGQPNSRTHLGPVAADFGGAKGMEGARLQSARAPRFAAHAQRRTQKRFARLLAGPLMHDCGREGQAASPVSSRSGQVALGQGRG